MNARSRTSRIARVAVVAMLAGVAILGLGGLVGAESANRIVDQGWWWRQQTGIGPAIPAPLYVGEDQLLVEGAPDGANAIAAVSLVVAEGQTDPVLELGVADAAGGEVALVLACQAGAAWTGVQAGRWDSAPLAACDAGSVLGELSDDGATLTFDLAGLQVDDRVSVVLVPGIDADTGTPSVFSMVLERADANSIRTQPAASPATTATSAPTSTTPVTSAGVAPPVAPPATQPIDSVVTPAPTAPVQPALDDDQQGLSATAPLLDDGPLQPVVDTEDAVGLARVLAGMVLVAALGAVVWILRAPTGAVASAEVPVVGGLARFRRERTSEPDPVS